ncbi:MAG: OmpA family protein [Flavobacteriales bacterium]|nr:OmpA family protein [Flavobacteriales bacterium]
MTAKAWFVLFLFALWCVFSAWFYNCKVKGLCGDQYGQSNNTASITTDNSGTDIADADNAYTGQNNAGTISSDDVGRTNTNEEVSTGTKDASNEVEANAEVRAFEANSFEIPALLGEELMADPIFQGLADNEKILITGKFFESENNASDQENLGFARAEAFKELLKTKIDVEQIEISSEVMEGDMEGVNMKDLLSFKKVTPSEEKQIAQRDGKVLVYFDYISDEPKLGDEVKTYLDQIANELVADRKKYIVATGYTDDVGNTKNNYYMGQHRAEAIREYLMAKGANKFQIHIKSYGEYRPIAENNTEEGRAKNRRVEIKLKY